MLISSITLDLPGQRLKLSLRSGVRHDARRRPLPSDVKIVKYGPDVVSFLNRSQVVFSGSVKFPKKTQNASVFRDKFPKICEISKFGSSIRMALRPNSMEKF